MGCDIHMHAERRVDGQWVEVPREVPNSKYGSFNEDPLENRSYAFFGWLADVRNYSHEVRAAYRQLVSNHHPDKGGDEQQMMRINAARDQLLKVE